MFRHILKALIKFLLFPKLLIFSFGINLRDSYNGGLLLYILYLIAGSIITNVSLFFEIMKQKTVCNRDMNKIMEPLELFYPMLLPVISYFCSCYREKLCGDMSALIDGIRMCENLGTFYGTHGR